MQCAVRPFSKHRMSSYKVLVRFHIWALLVVLWASVAAAQEFGTLSIRARPAGAEILIDGEQWTGSGETGPLQVELTPGSHRIDVRAPGRQTYVSHVTIRAGETTPLNVSLSLSVAVPRPEPPPAAAPRRPPSAAGPPQPGSVVEVTRVEDGAVFAPDVKFSEVNHEFATLVGAYAGYVFGGEVMFGGGGYWQANATNGLHIAYGGPVVEWRALRGKIIGLNLHALVGGGTVYNDYHDGYYGYNQGVYVDPRGRNGRVVAVVPPGYAYGYPYHYYDAFFIADPEAQLVIHFGSSVRLQGSVGYRATSTSSLNGVTGGISVQIGR
jgi:PEGA domain-containing protein